jgi:hypothetical protein
MTMQISISLKPDVVAHIDEQRGQQSRSSFIVGCIYEHFSGGDVDKKQLTEQLKALTVQQQQRESEIAFLREQTTKLTDALSQRLLAEPKKAGFFARFRRKKEG